MTAAAPPRDRSRPESARPAARRAPGPTGRRLVGSLRDVRRDPLAFVRRSHELYGDAVAFRMAHRRLYLFSAPEAFADVLSATNSFVKGPGLAEARPLLGDGLLTADDATAAEMRKVLAPAFSAARLRSHVPHVIDAVDHLSASWRDRGVIELREEMVSLALDVLGRTVFGRDVGRPAPTLVADLALVSEWSMRKMVAAVPLPLAAPTPRAIATRRALGRLESWARAMQDGDDPDDRTVPGLLQRSAVDSQRRRDELLTFLLAGHETTAALLTWTLLLLADHPAVQQQLHDEIDGDGGSASVDAGDLRRPLLLRAVLNEALRLYPPVWMIPRRTLHDTTIAGFHVPARSDVLLCTYTLHRHPRWWDHPDAFVPQRFLGDLGRDQELAYLPFGAGARSCVGGRFAVLEAELALRAVLQRFRITRVGGPRVEPNPSLTLKPAGAVVVGVEPRRVERAGASGTGGL